MSSKLKAASMDDVAWKLGERVKVPGWTNLFGRMRADGSVLFMHRVRQNGRDTFPELGVFTSLRAANEAREAERPSGKRVQRSKPGILWFSDELWERFVMKLPADNTRKRVRSQWRAHLRQTLNGQRVDWVGPDHVNAIINRMKRTGYTKGGVHREYADSAYASIQITISSFYSKMAPTAVNPIDELDEDDRYVNDDPTPVTVDDIPTVEEVAKIAAVLEKGTGRYAMHYRTMILLAPETGLRISEMFALQWSDIHWDEQLIDVERQLAPEYKVGEPATWFIGPKNSTKKKTKTRKVVVSRRAIELLREYREWAFANGFWSKNGLVFLSVDHAPLRRDLLGAELQAAIEEAGIERSITFHTFRHTFASRLFARLHTHDEIAIWLGDSTVVTEKTYTHLNKAFHAARVARFNLLEAEHAAMMAQ